MRVESNPGNTSPILGKSPSDDPALERLTSGIRVAWAMPSYGPIFAQVYSSHLSVIAYASRYFYMERIGDVPVIGATDRMYLHSAANEIVRQAKAAKLTHIFWTESDMIMPYNTLPKLMALGKPIVSGVYFLRGSFGQPCLFKRTPIETKENPYLHSPITIYDESGPFRVDCPGMGCVLMEMSVFDAVQEPYFDLKANDYGKTNGYGQDLYFYTKVRKAGIEVWVDPSVICDQIDTQIIGYADYRRNLIEKKGGFGGFIAADAAQR